MSERVNAMDADRLGRLQREIEGEAYERVFGACHDRDLAAAVMQQLRDRGVFWRRALEKATEDVVA